LPTKEFPMSTLRYGEGMSSEQLGELVKKFVASVAGRSHAEAQALLTNHIDWHIREMLDEQGSFTCDWVRSELEYPKAYTGLRPIEEQVHLVADEFRIDRKPVLKFLTKGLPDVPKWAEGWAALPIQEKFTDTYVNLIYKALIWHCTARGHAPGRYAGCGAPGGLTLEKHIRPHFSGPELEKVSCPRRNFAWLWEQKVGGRIMIVPVQMGRLRRGQSDRMVKACCLRRGISEFPLGIFEVACLLAMHPGRVRVYGEKALDVNAPGDEYTRDAYIKSGNCRWQQMGTWWSLDKSNLPYFGFARGEIRSPNNGPITASNWGFEMSP